jgi:heptosyltransferase-3
MKAMPLDLPVDAKILIIALRRLGDVLLTTPLIRSVRQAWPQATIHALVFADTSGILEENPDLNGIVTMPVRPTVAQSLMLAKRLWRNYDLAVSTQCGDRPTFFAVIAGRRRIAPVDPTINGRIKRAFFERSVPYLGGVHRVEDIMRVVDILGIPRAPYVVCPRPKNPGKFPDTEYAVVHAAPMFRYKQWPKNGWRELASWLSAHGLAVVASGGSSQAEREYLGEVWDGSPVIRSDSKLDWRQLVALLSNARVYVGPDTSVTHLAAATGCPTVAIYGPTDPRLWGPWPIGGLDAMWAASDTIQRRNNVWLVQNPLPCMPCQLEGCERRLDSRSACLDELASQPVIKAVEEALKSERAGTGKLTAGAQTRPGG